MIVMLGSKQYDYNVSHYEILVHMFQFYIVFWSFAWEEVQMI